MERGPGQTSAPFPMAERTWKERERGREREGEGESYWLKPDSQHGSSHRELHGVQWYLITQLDTSIQKNAQNKKILQVLHTTRTRRVFAQLSYLCRNDCRKCAQLGREIGLGCILSTWLPT